MITQRHLSRIVAMQTVFVYLNRGEINITENIEYAKTLLSHNLNNNVFSQELVEWVLKNEEKIRDIILENVVEKSLSKIDWLTMAILYIWVYELNFVKEKLAEAIIVNEAVELCKEYGKETSSSLVNAVLSTKK